MGSITTLSKEQRKPIMGVLEEILKPLNGTTSTALKANHYICYASKPNHLIVRANGRLAKCTVAFEDEKNDVGYIKPDGTLHIENAKLGFWFRGLYSKDKEILACPVMTYPHEVPAKKKVIPIMATA